VNSPDGSLLGASRHLALFLAARAPKRERERGETLPRYLLAALETVAVGALIQADQRVLDLLQRLASQLEQGEIEVFLHERVRHLSLVADFIERPAAVAGAHLPHGVPDLVEDLASPIFEQIAQLCVSLLSSGDLALRTFHI